jgi:L-alanine-DL-glutamate epimerase-like enolase superfamily enzyme
LKITGVECHVLLDPAYDVESTSSAQDDIVVEVHTDEGLSGVGETDVNPWIARACIEAPGTHTMGLGLTEMLLGQDPLDVEGLWERLYVGSAMNGRRGAVINAIGALDIALHDLRGKALGKPCYELLGGKAREAVTPYASLQPEVSSLEAYCESMVGWAKEAKRRGFEAAKLELVFSGPYRHKGLDGSEEDMVEILGAVRDAVGMDFLLMVDVAYGFPDVERAVATLKGWEDFDLYFVETPLASDDLEGYARVAAEQPIPIAAGEWLTTRFEFEDLMDRGGIRVAQPDVGRVGGLTEAKRVSQMAEDRDLTVVPHLWKTGISVAAAAHLAASSPNCPYIEFLSSELSESALRRYLLLDGPEMEGGSIRFPDKPGLGIDLDRDALQTFEEAARRAYA